MWYTLMPRVNSVLNKLMFYRIKEIHICSLVRFMPILKTLGMKKKSGELKCTSHLA